MPIYEYTCSSCGKEFEALVRGGRAAECPDCHGSELKKKLSTFAAISASGAAMRDLPPACQSCGHPDGPGACQMH